MRLSPETVGHGFPVWFQQLPWCKASNINIHHMAPNKVSKALFCQQVVRLSGPSDSRLPQAVWKIPPFSVEIYEGGSVPFSSRQPLWSHSPLADCLPNGHWQMRLKIARLAPLVPNSHSSWSAHCCFPISQLLTVHFFLILRVFWALLCSTFIFPLTSLSSPFCLFYAPHPSSEWKLIKYAYSCMS